MLTHLTIKNLAIITEQTLEFDSGTTVITGKTGAGKSMIISALALISGKRADSSVIHHDSDRCDINASFDITHNLPAQQWLQAHELIDDNSCILHRSITRDGRSRALINGQASPLHQIRELGKLLLDLHGQHEQQTLLQRDKQRQLLDNFANHTSLMQTVKATYLQWKKLTDQLQQLRTASSNAQQQALLNYQVQELDELSLQDHEITQLENEHKQLNQVEHITQLCRQALNVIAEQEQTAATTQLQRVTDSLATIQDLHPSLANACELLKNALIYCEEAKHEISQYAANISANPERLHEIETRLQQIHDIARKHHIKPEEVTELQQKLQQELSQLTQRDEQIEILTEDIKLALQQYQQAAAKLGASRQKAAQALQQQVTKKLQQLEIPEGKFAIQPNKNQNEEPSAYGDEAIEFMVSTNPGHPLQPLAKIASGGELSRVSLAIHVLTAQQDTTPTLLFDEVDVGIGGSTAAIVGQMLRTLGETTQILCITHLPQVAAQGHHHIQVSKQTRGQATHTQTAALDRTAKIQEIARMLSGLTVTAQTLKHAEELLSS